VTAAGVAFTLLFLTPLLAHVPVAVLAAIIVVAASGLLDVEQMRLLTRIRRSDGAVALLTFGITLVVGPREGILVGVAFAVIVLLYRIGRPNTAVLGHLPGTRSFADVRSGKAQLLEGILILRVDASFSFMNAEYLKDLILGLSRDPERGARVLVLDASAIIDLDATAVSVLHSIMDTLGERQVPLYVAGVKENVLEILVRAGLFERVGTDRFVLSAHRAVRHILTGWGRSEEYLERLRGAEALEREGA
jgi:SulP family sulfate permease